MVSTCFTLYDDIGENNIDDENEITFGELAAGDYFFFNNNTYIKTNLNNNVTINTSNGEYNYFTENIKVKICNKDV